MGEVGGTMVSCSFFNCLGMGCLFFYSCVLEKLNEFFFILCDNIFS